MDPFDLGVRDGSVSRPLSCLAVRLAAIRFKLLSSWSLSYDIKCTCRTKSAKSILPFGIKVPFVHFAEVQRMLTEIAWSLAHPLLL
jgi:hypothetical protein